MKKMENSKNILKIIGFYSILTMSIKILTVGEDMKKRLLQALITSVVVSSFVIAPVAATPQEKVESLEQQKSQVEAQAASVNSELVNLLVEYQALQKDMEVQKQRIEQASDDLTAAEKEEKKQYEDMKLRIKYMYEEGDTSFVEAVMTAESYADLVSKSEYVQKVHEYDRKMLKQYVETKEEVKELKVNLEAGQADMEAMSQDMEVQKETMESTLNTMRSQIANFDTQLEQAKIEAQEELRRLEQAAQAAINAPESITQDSKPQTGRPGSQIKPERPEDETDKNVDNDKTDNDKEEQAPSNPGNKALGRRIADRACEYIGNKYVYGGNSLTNGIDCSAFVQQIHKQFGISTPRTSSALRTRGKAVSYSEMLPGDVICYSGHVAIYIGNNTVVHASNSAPYPKGGIKTTSPANYRTVLAVRRYW